jgi:hypothetical protein
VRSAQHRRYIRYSALHTASLSDSLRWKLVGWRATAAWLGRRDEWHRDFLPPLFAFLSEITVTDEDALRSFLAGVATAAFDLMAHAVDAMERATFGLLLRLLSVYLKVRAYAARMSGLTGGATAVPGLGGSVFRGETAAAGDPEDATKGSTSAVEDCGA